MQLNYTTVIGIIASLGSFIWTVYIYTDSRKREQDLKEFENYHRLIKGLVQPNDDKETMYIDRQAAVIYELRHFKRYYSFSYRTLISLRSKWAEVPNQYPRLIEELDISIDFLKNKIKNKSI